MKRTDRINMIGDQSNEMSVELNIGEKQIRKKI